MKQLISPSKSGVRSQKSEVESQKSEVRSLKSGVRKSEVGNLKSEENNSEIENPTSEIKNNSAFDTPHSELTKWRSPLEHPEKTNKSEKSEIENSTSEIKMEVHHHPDLHHEKKPWKEYLLEGLMIFLAVFMGFVAENVREGISEHKRATEFARSYFEDIKKDTAALNAAMHFSKRKIGVLDSALAMLRPAAGKQNDTVLYRRLSVNTNVMPFEPSAGTYEQIKSSGSLRFFDQALVNLMNSYDVQVKKTVKREDIDLKFIVEQVMPFAIKNFNSEVIYDVYFSHHISHELYFADRSKAALRQLINYTVVVKIERLRAMAEYTRQMKISETLLAELRKEYHLE